MVINLSVGGREPAGLERLAIEDAIAAGVIFVSSAGNRGEAGMDWPAAYPQSISVGVVGWTGQFRPGSVDEPNRDFWWGQDVANDPDQESHSEADEAYVASLSARAIPSLGFASGAGPQELDVVAPGMFTVAPGDHGKKTKLFFWAGTSFSAPIVAGVAALLLDKDPVLSQVEVELALKSTALNMNRNDSRTGILDPFISVKVHDVDWDTDCDGAVCDPVGAGLVQADAALASVSGD